MKPGDPASGGLSKKRIKQALDASLKRLKTDHVDIYMPMPGPQGPAGGDSGCSGRRGQGRQGPCPGCSNFPGASGARPWQLAAPKGWPRFEFDQVEYSLVARSADGDVLPVTAAEKTSVMAWSPLAGGYLTGRYLVSGKRPKGRRQDPAKAFPPVDESRYGGVVRVLGSVAVQEKTTPSAAALAWVLSRPGLALRWWAPAASSSCARTSPSGLSAKSLGFLDQASIICSRASGSKGPAAAGTFCPIIGAKGPAIRGRRGLQ